MKPFEPIIDRRCHTFADHNNVVYAYIPQRAYCVPIRHPEFREYFVNESFNELSLIPTNRQFRSILDLLEGRAKEHTFRYHPILRRVSEKRSHVFPTNLLVHLNNSHDHVVDISSSGFAVNSAPNLYFEGSRSALPLPTPQRAPLGADPAAPLQLLRNLLNLASPADWLRSIAWLLACFRSEIPAPLALFQGPPSSGKSIAARLFRLFIDPATCDFPPVPSSVRELHSLVRHTRLLVLDHISALSPKLTDALCRLSSGAGVSLPDPGSRSSEPVYRQYKTPTLLTTTDRFACPDDLAQRALTIHFAPLPPDQRISSDEINLRLHDHRGEIFGAICHVLSVAIRRLPEIENPRGRLPEVLHLALAACPALGCTEAEMRDALNYTPPDPTVEAVTHLLRDESNFTGTATDLLHLLPASPFYSTAKGVSQHLKHKVGALEAAGIQLRFTRVAGTGKRLLHLTQSPPCDASFADEPIAA